MLTKPRSGWLRMIEGKGIGGEEVKTEEANITNGPKFNIVFEQN